MTDDEQRIAIAAACGWKPAPCSEGVWRAPDNTHHDNLPDYLNDLNAINKAEGYADEEYIRTLVDVVQAWINAGHAPEGGDWFYWTVRASAAQRAEAFLRTTGRWKDQ